jgi:hypothetical protein
MAGLDLKKLFISNSNAPVLVLTKCLLFIILGVLSFRKYTMQRFFRLVKMKLTPEYSPIITNYNW